MVFRMPFKVFIDDAELAGVTSVHERLYRSPEHRVSVRLEGWHFPGVGFDTSRYIVNRGALDEVLRYEFCLDANLIEAPDGTRYFYTSEYTTGDRVTQWCEANGYTDPFQQEGQWWAFPPNGVMPVTIDALIPPLKAQDPPLHYRCRCIAPDPDGACRRAHEAYIRSIYR